MYAEADAANQSASAMEADYRRHLEDLEGERDEMMREAAARARRQEELIVADARRQADAIRAAGQARLAQERKKAVNELKNELGGMAVELAGKVVERELNEEDNKRLIDEFIQNVGEAS